MYINIYDVREEKSQGHVIKSGNFFYNHYRLKYF